MQRRPFPNKAKQPPPAQGIKVQKIGATWWGQRWIEALEHLSRDYLSRLGRGRAYARAGRVHDLHVAPGKVTALVTGSEDVPYRVTLRIAMLSPASWKKVIATMAKQAVFSAELLAGRMPAEIDDAFRASGHSLFLVKQRELETDCTCPDWANPCKHVAAVHYVLGEAFDKDPFLLFELRGRTKQQVLGALRSLRSGDDSEALLEKLASGVHDSTHETEVEVGISVAGIDSDDYERSSAPLPTLHLQMRAPTVAGAVLKQLGAPPSWPPTAPGLEVFAERLAAASALAHEWALAGSELPDADLVGEALTATDATAEVGDDEEYSTSDEDR